jgi:hypothetical protein
MRDDAIVGHFAVGGSPRFAKTQVEQVGFRVVIDPKLLCWKVDESRNRLQDMGKFFGCNRLG